MLRLYQSNRLEVLSHRLAELLAEPVVSPLSPETLVVQHPGMARWLSLEIARANGISANIRFPLPASFIWELLRMFLPDVPLNNRFDPSRLSWRIFQALARLGEDPVFAPLQSYLQTGDELRRFQLAERLAGLFDRYLVYRPDWIMQWEAGQNATPGDAWQAALWRQLSAQADAHWVALQQRLFAYSGKPPIELPPRLFLIGVPTLSPGYLQIIQWLSQWIDVHLLLLNPCQEHWAEIVDLREQARRELEADGSELYLEVGNPLLASMGRQGRDFFAAINEFDPGSEEWFVDPGEATLLQRVQRQILRLEPTQAAESGEAEADPSIALHLCHSPMREVEVLYDQLLAMLDEAPGLTPADILVMTPDIDTYAPLIQAVFAEAGDRPSLPYRISDLGMDQENRHASAFLELLSLPGSRFTVNQVLGLLEIPAISHRFGLDESALEEVVGWIEAANIRWGRDAESKRELGLPAEPGNTWQAGLEQLLLGYAMPAGSEALWQGTAPLNAVEGSSAQWLGGLLEFCHALFSLEAAAARARPVAEWCDWLRRLTGRFFAADKQAEQPLQQVRDAIQNLQDSVLESAFNDPVTLPLIRQRLQQAFARAGIRGFLGGGINFCALAPMRSLPSRVVCLIGMNDGQFPREQPVLSLDLMGRQFRFGDRSRRADDRYLFLETLISARHRLYISYVGRSLKDNSHLPPSVLVDELRDYMASQLTEEAMQQLVHVHPLQPFSPEYFTGHGELPCYSARMQAAAKRVGLGQKVSVALVNEPLPVIEELPHQVELSGLIHFFTNPAAAFAQQRLNIRLESASVLLEEREAFVLEGFEADELEEMLVTALMEERSPDIVFQRLGAKGIWPQGNPGRREFQRRLISAREMSERLKALQPGAPMPEQDLQLEIGGMHLVGRLRGLYEKGLFTFSSGRFYPHKLLALWIRHLVLNQVRPDGIENHSRWLEGQGGGWLRPVDEAERHLGQLLDLYWQGHQSPLHFYPGTSWAYSETLKTREDPQAAYQAAVNKWQGNEFFPGDADKPYHRLLLPGDEMLDQGLIETSEAVFGPLLAHLELDRSRHPASRGTTPSLESAG